MTGPRRPRNLSEASDQLLAERSGDGDLRAFETLIRRHGPLLRATAHRILGSTDEVDDVVQETFITAWMQLPGMKHTTGVKSWLITVASRKSIDRLRARKQHEDISDHEDAVRDHRPVPEDAVVTSSRGDALSRALSKLPEDQRQCWFLKEIAQYSYQNIARELELPVSTVRGALARARRNLMQEMEVWR